MTDQRKRGRPPLEGGAARSRVIQIRVREAERDAIEAAAEATGVSVSEWSRAKLVAAAKRAK